MRTDLGHFLHADDLAGVTIAMRADRDVEFHLLVAFVGLRLAQIPGRAGPTEHRAGETPLPAILQRDDADIDVALFEDAVLDEEIMQILQDGRKGLAPSTDVLDQPRRAIDMHPAGAEIVGMQTGAGCALVEHHELLALLEAPQRRRQRAAIHGLRRHIEQMRQNAADLAEQDPDQLGAARHLDRHQILDGEAECVLLVHRSTIVEPVEIRDVLEVGPRLHELLRASVQQADVRIDPFDDLTIELEHEAQNPMGGRVLWAEVDRKITFRVGGLGPIRDDHGVTQNSTSTLSAFNLVFTSSR